MPANPANSASPESEQIADVAINDEETIVRRPPLDGGEADASPGTATEPSERSD